MLQPDGKLVVTGLSAYAASSPGVGDMFVTRFLPDGHLDPTFGRGGTATTGLPNLGNIAYPAALLQQADGQLVVAGTLTGVTVLPCTQTYQILLARYQALGCPAVDPEPCLAHLGAVVTDVYRAALARPPEASEVASWLDVLTTTPTLATVRGMLQPSSTGPNFASGR